MNGLGQLKAQLYKFENQDIHVILSISFFFLIIFSGMGPFQWRLTWKDPSKNLVSSVSETVTWI